MVTIERNNWLIPKSAGEYSRVRTGVTIIPSICPAKVAEKSLTTFEMNFDIY